MDEVDYELDVPGGNLERIHDNRGAVRSDWGAWDGQRVGKESSLVEKAKWEARYPVLFPASMPGGAGVDGYGRDRLRLRPGWKYTEPGKDAEPVQGGVNPRLLISEKRNR
jgi:hypothetical protein